MEDCCGMTGEGVERPVALMWHEDLDDAARTADS